ncbi:hypothetical protein BH23THE1_BH23THE1_07360 [soil metagenome]
MSEFWTTLISDIENLQDLGLSIISQTDKLNDLKQEIIKLTKQKQITEMSNYNNPCIYLISVINSSNYFIFYLSIIIYSFFIRTSFLITRKYAV